MRFTKDHQWLDLDGELATVGITAYAADQLGDVVGVTLPQLGKALKTGEAMADVESVKVDSELAAPLDGEVAEVNASLPDTPEMINEAPETLGWILKLKIADPAAVEALMDRAAYEAYLDSL
jgi:glycine cleavage system H protein